MGFRGLFKIFVLRKRFFDRGIFTSSGGRTPLPSPNRFFLPSAISLSLSLSLSLLARGAFGPARRCLPHIIFYIQRGSWAEPTYLAFRSPFRPPGTPKPSTDARQNAVNWHLQAALGPHFELRGRGWEYLGCRSPSRSPQRPPNVHGRPPKGPKFMDQRRPKAIRQL